MVDIGFWGDHRDLIHTRDGKYCPAFETILEDGGGTPVRLPPRSSNVNLYMERWVRSVMDGCWLTLIRVGEPALRTTWRDVVDRFHRERNHQGEDNLRSDKAGQSKIYMRPFPVIDRDE